MKNEDITAANRAAWEEAAALHRRQNMARLLERFSVVGYSCLDVIETAILNKLGVAGKDVAQLCCNNGRELISVKNMGAARCVGFDGAEDFIAQAREITAAASADDCQFECVDLYGIGPEYNASFDLVTVTIGVLGWMPDLMGFFAVAARLLKLGGTLFLYEQHPILEMIEPGKRDDPVLWNYDYFDAQPTVDTDGLDYYGGATYESKPKFWFIHKLSDVIMTALKNSLFIADFQERPDHISNTWYNVEHQGPRLPMSYTLVLTKPSQGV
jgi:SAM-dependent methyltransferase